MKTIKKQAEDFIRNVIASEGKFRLFIQKCYDKRETALFLKENYM
jgi:hypothetical protein